MVESKPNHSREDEMLVDHSILAVPAQINEEFEHW